MPMEEIKQTPTAGMIPIVTVDDEADEAVECNGAFITSFFSSSVLLPRARSVLQNLYS